MNTREHSAPARMTPPVIVNDVTMPVVEVDGQRVVTLATIDRVHGRPEGTAGRNFRENVERLTPGKHFHIVSSDEIRRNYPNALPAAFRRPEITVMTERGYLMLVKSFTDDLAWQVQDTLVESYFKKPELPALPSRGPRIDVSREHRLTMKDQVMYAKMAGFTGNQVLLAANRATALLTGIDNLGLLGASALPAPQNEALLSPSDIAVRAGFRSGRAVNERLCELVLQTRHRDHKGQVYYEPTEAGAQAGGTMQDTGKKRSDGTPVRQLRWASSIISTLGSPVGLPH